MGLSTLVFVLVVVQCVLNTDGHQDKQFFRKDYTYVDGTQSFYKIHTLMTTWTKAKTICEQEGAELFYPKDNKELIEVVAFWNHTQPQFSRIYIGISDILEEGSFVTVDGRAVGVYNNWASSEPNNGQGMEDCVAITKDGKMYDISCYSEFPYICKKALKDVQWDQKCHMPSNGYVYNANFDRCYKFHNEPNNWLEAYKVCEAEMSYLVVINSKAEAEFLAKWSSQSKHITDMTLDLLDQVLVGFHNQFKDGWKTVTGESLEASGYAAWGDSGPIQPDGGDDELCGSMFFDRREDNDNAKLNDVPCERRLPYFICEHEISNTDNLLTEQ